jgi:AraC family transcriptional regulator
MNYLAHVQRGLDFIEARLDDELDPGEVARAAGISQWHFQRIFKALTSDTLKAYIRARRFAAALDALVEGNARILDIAIAAGFETHESFTRAFKAAFGVTPDDYRRGKTRFPIVPRLQIDADYLAHLQNSVSLEPELYDQRELSVVGLRTRFYGIDSERNNLADKLPALWSRFVPRLRTLDFVRGVVYGIVQQTPAHTDELDYLACVELAPSTPIPDDLVHWTIPASRRARFTHRGLPTRIDQSVNYVYASWLVRSDYRHTYAADIEIYGPGYRPDAEDSTIDYAIPIALDV